MQTNGRYGISWVEKTESTSSAVKAAMGSMPSFAVIAAMEQTAGRGQGDHKWLSQAGENLTFSILVKYDETMPLRAEREQLLTMASSVAIVDFLDSLGVRASIKKPNDIYVEDKKICGMLIENGISASSLRWSVIGIGLNVNQEHFPLSLPNPTSVILRTGRRLDIKKCLEEFLLYFSRRFDSIWESPENLVKRYDSLLLETK